MARLTAGGTAADYTILRGDQVTIGTPSGGEATGNEAVVVGGIEVTWWNDRTGGTRYTDLLDEQGNAVTGLPSSDGSNGWDVGQIPLVQYPEGVTGAWASADGGPRVWMPADTSALAAAAAAQADGAQANLQAHIDAANPHSTGTTDLVDVSSESPTDGQMLVWDAELGQWVPMTATGLNPADFVNTAGGSTITIPSGDITTSALIIRVPPGDRSSAVNTFEVWWNAGTDATPNWQLVTRLNEYGEFRGQSSHPGRVFGRVKQYSSAQTGNLWEFTDYANNPLSWVDAQGRMRAPNIGLTVGPWHQEVGATGPGTYRWYNPTPGPLILRGFVVSAGGTAPNGDYIINPKLDGNPVYSSANRPKITSGQRTSGLVTALTTTTIPAGSYITVDVDAVPSTPPTVVTIQGIAY